MQNFFARLIPFVLLGMALVAFAFGIVLFAYLLLFGAIVGLVLFVIAWIRDKLMKSKRKQVTKTSHRTIDHDSHS